MRRGVPHSFNPSSGAGPPLLVGRETSPEEFTDAVDNGPEAAYLRSHLRDQAAPDV